MVYRILVSDPLSEYGLQKLLQAPDVEVVQKTGLSEAELIQLIPDFDALLVRSQTKVTAQVLEAGRRLKAVGRAGVGVDNIDLEAATRYGIAVINAPDGNTITTSEHTFAMLLALARRIPQAYRSTIQGEWRRKDFVGVELRDKILGIIGFGRIGSEVAKRAKAFQMKILAYDPFLTRERAEKMGIVLASLDEIYRQADFITVHTPLNKDTRHMISTEAFEKMKQGVRIINCARGGIIDEKALVEAIRSGKVAGAALDVFENEPPAKDNPLLSMDEVIVTPHLGASTVEAQENVALDVSEEILHLLRGEPFKNAVNLPSIPPEMMEKIQPYFDLCEKLGLFVAQMADSGIKEVVITYSGELRDLNTDPLTRNVLKGILSYYLTGEVNYINAPHLAAKKEIHVLEQKSSHSRGFTSLITVTLRTSQEEHSVSGTLLNGYGARIIKIDNYSIDVEPSGHFLLISHQDKPGMIGQVGQVLGDNGINIATMQVGRQSAGGKAIMLLSIDKEADPDVLAKIQDLADIHDVTEIDL